MRDCEHDVHSQSPMFYMIICCYSVRDPAETIWNAEQACASTFETAHPRLVAASAYEEFSRGAELIAWHGAQTALS